MSKLSISLLIFGCLSYLVAGQILAESSESMKMNEVIHSTNDDEMFEDDMKIKKQSNTRGFGLKNKNQRWQGGVMPYIISAQFNSNEKQTIRSAMDLFEKKTTGCMRFVERTNQQDYISIIKDGGCWSYVGRNGGVQQLSLASGCVWKGTIIHELMHATGFMHEQNRPDRDDYIEVRLENVPERNQHNFKKYTDTFITYGPYDYYSIMHYTSTAFSNNGEKTIIPLKDDITLKHSARKTDEEILTSLDVQAIKTLYECTVENTTPMVTTEDNFETTTEDNFETTTEDNFETTTEDNFETTTEDNFETTTEDNLETTTEDNFETTTEDNFETTTEDNLETTTESTLFYKFSMTNDLLYKVKVYWVNYEGKETLYRTLYPGKKYTQYTYKGHKWVVKTYCDVKKFVMGKGKFRKSRTSVKVSEI